MCLWKVLGNHCWLLSKALRAGSAPPLWGCGTPTEGLFFSPPSLKSAVVMESISQAASFCFPSLAPPPTYKMWTLSLLSRLHFCCQHPPSDLSPCPCSVAEMTTRLPCPSPPPPEMYGQRGLPRPGPLHVGGAKWLRSGQWNVWLRKTTSEILHVLWQMVVY